MRFALQCVVAMGNLQTHSKKNIKIVKIFNVILASARYRLAKMAGGRHCDKVRRADKATPSYRHCEGNTRNNPFYVNILENAETAKNRRFCKKVIFLYFGLPRG